MTDPFAVFVTDPANAAAVSAARTVADLGRPVYGPLVIQGPRGSGKTHLLRAVRDRATSAATPRQVELVSMRKLSELMNARGFGEGAAALRDRLLGVDLLLIDDFEAVTRQLGTQAFVYDVIESRLTSDREVVVASAVPLAELTGLDGRLRRRLEGGTAVTLGLPGAEARLAILERHVKGSGVQLGPSVADALARQEFRSVKEYLGALRRVLAFQQAAAEPIPAADALALIGVEPAPPNGNGSARSELPVAEPDATPAALRLSPPEPPSEFDAFLSEVVANVVHQFDQWRSRLREAIAHWQSHGIRTRRLELAMQDELGGDPEPVIAEFGRDAAEVTRLAAEARVLAPDLAGAEILRDPDQLAAARALVEEARARRAPLSAPLSHLTLDGLGVGAANRLALEAARSVVAAPGARYNPLLLVGPSGVGKTHLLHGIGNALAEGGTGPVACLSGHSFVGEVAELRSDEAAAWRGRYEWVAAFLMDDLHVLAGESRAQQELLHIFGALADAGRPLVFSSSRRLTDLEAFDARLLTRLEGGLVVDVLPPDRDIRLAVVKAALGSEPGSRDAALIDYLAGRPADSVRAVQGAVQRVLGEARAQHVLPSPALAREVLETAEPRAARADRRTHPARVSGILSPGLGVARSGEKMVLGWPRPADRLIEELR